jgi:hypothetical protein
VAKREVLGENLNWRKQKYFLCKRYYFKFKQYYSLFFLKKALFRRQVLAFLPTDTEAFLKLSPL